MLQSELLPVVDTLAENDLAVHLNAVFIEPVHFFQRFPGETVVEHLTAELSDSSPGRTR